MITKITTITGPGGTGKTYTIKGLCESFSKAGQQVIYVTFNKETAIKTKAEIKLPGVHISTIHALAYQELRKVGRVPDGFKAKTLNQAEPTASNESFTALIDTFLDFFITNDLPSPGERFVLFVDEFQNVGSDLMEVLKLICTKHDVDLYLVGDPNQALYGYSETHQTDNFGTIEETFGHKIDYSIHLRKNHRSNPSIQKLINGFLTKGLKTEQDGLYSVEDSTIEPQEVFFFTKREEEFEHVKEEALRWHEETGKKVAIIARSKRNMSLFLDWMERDKLDWLVLSTIHAYIGNEADRVFIVGFENPKDSEEARIYYTGFIRAKERLCLTTSFPLCDLARTFDPATLKVINRQRTVSKPFKALKVIKKNKNLTRGKFERCMIDSVTVAVKGRDVPFSPFIKPQGGLDSNGFTKSLIIKTEDQIQIKVVYHCSHRLYFFEMKDVNLLRTNDYTDAQVIKYITNVVLKFFNYQITTAPIYLHEIDLCKIVEEEHELIGLLKLNRLEFVSRLNNLGQPVEKFTIETIKDRSVYFNFTSKETMTSTLAVYRPINKENQNRYFDPKAIKLELRYRRAAIEARYGFGGLKPSRKKGEDVNGSKVISVDDLLRWGKEDHGFLGNVFMSTIGYRMKKVGGFWGCDGEGELDGGMAELGERGLSEAQKELEMALNGLVGDQNGLLGAGNQ